MFYLALFGLFLFAGRIGETVRVRDGGGVKGGGGGGDRLGSVPAHQLRGGQRWGRFLGAHSRAGDWSLLLQGVYLFLTFTFFLDDKVYFQRCRNNLQALISSMTMVEVNSF